MVHVAHRAQGGVLADAEFEIFCTVTGRVEPPATPVTELWLLLGRRSGKSIVAALLAVYAACVRQYDLAPGETPTVGVFASDRRQARVVKRYISGLLHAAPPLRELVATETADRIELTTGVNIEILTSSHRVSRGYTYVAAICDEMAFWRSEDSADPDREVLNALRPGMATVAGAMLVVLSSVYSRRGETWRVFQRHHGQDGDPVLVVKGPTRAFNPTIPQEVIDAAYADDPLAAAAEWGSEFRTDVESFVRVETIDAVTVAGRYELPPISGVAYTAFLDAAGGSGRDSMTMSIAHVQGDVAVLDLIREVRPPFSPETVTAEFADGIKRFGLDVATADRFAGDWPRERFAKRGVTVIACDRSKSELYVELLPRLNSGKVELLDTERLRQQLLGLERKTGRTGKDSVDHTPGGHDDIINAVAGAVVLAAREAARPPLRFWGGGPVMDEEEEETFEAYVMRRGGSYFPHVD